jgi:hypothetical protein
MKKPIGIGLQALSIDALVYTGVLNALPFPDSRIEGSHTGGYEEF